MRKEVVFRADANHNIGMGHIMRTLSIADAFTSAGNRVCFVLADNTVQSLVQSRGYKAIILDSDYTRMEDEIWPQDLQLDLLIVDSYFVTAEYLSSLHEKMKGMSGKLVYIDDVLSFPYPVDILVDYNAYSTQSIYDKMYENQEQPQLILGPTFAPLRSMFRDIEKKEQLKKVQNVLISTGGSDEMHLALTILQYLNDQLGRGGSVKQAGDYIYHFLIGAMSTDKNAINVLANSPQNKGRIELHENVTDMKTLISSCDLAVSAAGSMLYEISACGVPLITYSLADNQIPGAKAFERLGLAVSVGDLRNLASIDPNIVMSGTLDSSAVERILKAVEMLSADYGRRVEMGKQMQDMIDGFGADRMVQEILRLF